MKYHNLKRWYDLIAEQCAVKAAFEKYFMDIEEVHVCTCIHYLLWTCPFMQSHHKHHMHVLYM